MWDCYKQLERVTKKWEKDYPNAMKSWHTNWDVISPIFKFSAEVRKVIYTTNAIESLNSGYRRLNKQRGSVHPHNVFEAQVYVLTKDEGGRHTPFFSNYRPQFYFRTTDVTGIITLPEGTEMCMPGDNVMMHVELLTPVAMEEGLRFAIREGGRTVGSGVVGKIIE